MALFTKTEMVAALKRLGELAAVQGETIRLYIVGGANIVLQYEARESTKDIDAVILGPEPASNVRLLVGRVAEELELPEDWLNEAAKGYVSNHVKGDVVLQAPGVCVYGAPPAHMLALKLRAWRDDVDFSDAELLLGKLRGSKDEIWAVVSSYIPNPDRLKASYAYTELWEFIRDGPDGEDGAGSSGPESA